MRSGLSAILSAYPALIVKEVPEPSGPSADVVVWSAPEEGGLLPSGTGPGSAPVLALVGAEGEAQRALRAGARGALSRSASPESIPPAALAVAAGHLVIGLSFGPALLKLGAAPAPAAQELSPREREVLSLLADGLSNRLIAERLGISRHTAKFHVNAILDKLGAQSRTEAVVLAVRSGRLSL